VTPTDDHSQPKTANHRHTRSDAKVMADEGWTLQDWRCLTELEAEGYLTENNFSSLLKAKLRGLRQIRARVSSPNSFPAEIPQDLHAPLRMLIIDPRNMELLPGEVLDRIGSLHPSLIDQVSTALYGPPPDMFSKYLIEACRRQATLLADLSTVATVARSASLPDASTNNAPPPTGSRPPNPEPHVAPV